MLPASSRSAVVPKAANAARADVTVRTRIGEMRESKRHIGGLKRVPCWLLG